MQFDDLKNKLEKIRITQEAQRLEVEALFGFNKKPDAVKIPSADDMKPLNLQPSWEGGHGMGGADGSVNSDGSFSHITDKLDGDGKKVS